MENKEYTIEEKNRVIAEFMGYSVKSNFSGSGYLFITPNGEVLGIHKEAKELAWGIGDKTYKYHSSYDWLVPVCIKFRELKFEDRSLEAVSHKQMCDLLTRIIIHKNISYVHGEIFEAIKWYNSIQTTS